MGCLNIPCWVPQGPNAHPLAMEGAGDGEDKVGLKFSEYSNSRYSTRHTPPFPKQLRSLIPVSREMNPALTHGLEWE